jgi:hypothetical protein
LRQSPRPSRKNHCPYLKYLWTPKAIIPEYPYSPPMNITDPSS